MYAPCQSHASLAELLTEWEVSTDRPQLGRWATSYLGPEGETLFAYEPDGAHLAALTGLDDLVSRSWDMTGTALALSDGGMTLSPGRAM